MMMHLSLDPRLPLGKQIFSGIKERIHKGILSGGFRLPSSRELAAMLGVSRSVVVDVYERLQAEGYLDSRPGGGTFVADGAVTGEKPLPPVDPGPLSPAGFQLYRRDCVDFRTGLPDLERFPLKLWRQLTNRVLDRLEAGDLAYSSPEGRRELRKSIRDYLEVYRGVVCHEDQVLITGGTTQAIGIIARLLLDRNKPGVVVEEPVTRDIREIIRGQGGVVHPVAVDRDGLICSRLPWFFRGTFAYVTPSHHFPLGVTMPVQRRLELLAWAREIKGFIVEDDYDSEFSSYSTPLSTFHELAPEDVIYIGTFSKTLFPALRTGYIVFPRRLIEKGRHLKWTADLHNNVITQLVLALFLEEGHFVRHLGKMKKLYRRKGRFLEEELVRLFSHRLELPSPPRGIHLAARFKDCSFSPSFLDECLDKGVKLYPAAYHALNGYEDTLLFGFGMLSEEKMRAGLEIFKTCLDRD